MKKVRFILLLIAFILIANVQASAISYEMHAEKLSTIGIFKGTENGYELERQPTRLEGLIMLIRLLGKENEALKLNKEQSVFIDVPDWGRGYVNYAYKNGLTKGLGNGLFGTNDILDGKSYTTFLLRALGYSDKNNADFSWQDAVLFGKSIGLLDEEIFNKINNSTFIRDYIVKMTYDALQTYVKDNGFTLLKKLVNDGVLTDIQAQNLIFNENSQKKELTSIEIGRLSKGAVMLHVVGYDNSAWSGSGFYIDSNGGIVTNYHVINGAKSIKIIDDDGSIYTGEIKVLGIDDYNDIALIDTDKASEIFLEIGDSDNIQIGEEIYAIGSPLGLSNTLSNGIISSIRKDLIQISAPISQGSSGGALIDKYGKVVGITSSGYIEGENLGFAVPVNLFKSMSKNLSISLEGLHNMAKIIDRPKNVTLKQIDEDSISIYWDKNPEADYYRVYEYNSYTNTYEKIADKYGNDMWYWSPEVCIEYSGINPNETVYIVVTAIKGKYESEFSDIAYITLSSNNSFITFEEMQDYLLERYSYLIVKNTYIKLDFFYIDYMDESNMLYVSLNFSDDLSDFLNIFVTYRNELAQEIADIAAEVADYYGIDSVAAVIYHQTFNFYPDAFLNNNLYSNTITYQNDYWIVFYPYVQVVLNYKQKTYDTYWAF